MLIRDSVLYILARLVPGAVMVGGAAVLTRFLDPAEYGVYGFALVIMNLGAGIGFDWLGPTFLRLYEGRRRDPRAVPTFFILFFTIVAVSAAVAVVAIAIGLVPSADRTIFVVGVGLVWAYSWFEMVSRFEIADFRPFPYFVLYLTRAMLMVAGAIVAVAATGNPVWAAGGAGLGLAASSLCGRVRLSHLAVRGFDRAFAAEILRFGAPMWATLTFGSLMIVGTRGLVGLLGSTAALGIFTVAFALVQNALFLLGSGIVSATVPAAVRAMESEGIQQLRQHLLASATLILAITLPASLGMALTARGFALLLVAPQFVSGVATLTPWLAFAAFFQIFRTCYLDLGFQLTRRPVGLVWILATACAVSTGLSALLIPRMGAVGGAIGLTVALGVSCVHCWLLGLRTFPMPLPVKQGGQILACCVVMAAAVLAVPGVDRLAFAARVTAGVAAYGSMAMALNLVGLRDYVMRVVAPACARAAAWAGRG